MNRTRFVARRLVAGLFLGFLLLIVLSYKKPGSVTTEKRSDVAPVLEKEALDEGKRDRVRFRAFEYVETRAEEGTYRLRAAEALGFEERGEQVFRLKDAVFESKEAAPGRSVVIAAPRAEFSEKSRSVRVFDGVRIEGEETTLHGASFHYEARSRVFLSDGPVTGMRREIVLCADAGRVETRAGIVGLDGNVRMRGRLETGSPIDLEAPSLRIGRDGVVTANGGVSVRTGDGLLHADAFERTPEGAGDHLRASGHARLLVPPRGPRVTAPLLARGDALELIRDGDGSSSLLVLTSAAGDARLDLAPADPSGARGALSARFEARLISGRLREVNVPEKVTALEARPAGGPAGSGLRSLAAGYARLVFQGDGTSLDTATFEKGVVFTDGTRATLTAPHGTVRGADETAVFSGDPGTPARYKDERGSLTAAAISYLRREDRIDASGDVQASYTGEGSSGLLGGPPGEPFHSRSETFRLLVARKELTLGGGVQAWQKENVLRCRTLTLDDTERSLTADGSVKANLRRRLGGGPGTGGEKTTVETINASGEHLTHREADRFVRIAGGATIVSGSWVMTSDTTDIRLGTDRSIEYAEARGAVVLEDRVLHRRGEGTKATWRPQTDLITLDGSPATAIDGSGNRLTGAVLTFRQGRSRVDVESSGEFPSEAVLKPEKS